MSNAATICTKVIHDALAEAFPDYKFPPGKDEPAKTVIDNAKVGRELSAPCPDKLAI